MQAKYVVYLFLKRSNTVYESETLHLVYRIMVKYVKRMTFAKYHCNRKKWSSVELHANNTS